MSTDIKDNESLTSIEVTVTQSQRERLQKMADRFGVSLEELLRADIVEILESRETAFQEAADYVLTKNAELYRRLAN